MLDKNSLVTTIDGDTIPWIVGYNYRDSDDTISALANVDSYVESLLSNTSCTHYIGFLGGTKCFRYDIAKHKPYKGQRPEIPDWYKKWGGVMKAHLRDKWLFKVVDGIEADDAVSISAHELRFLGINYILCHADKDLRQLEGNHYNLRTHKREYISQLDGYRTLFKQVLIGDSSDNIEGLKGIGPKKASGFIDGLSNEYDMASMCRLLFDNVYHDKGVMYDEMYTLCKLLNTGVKYGYTGFDYIEIKKEEILNEDTTLNDIIADIWG